VLRRASQLTHHAKKRRREIFWVRLRFVDVGGKHSAVDLGVNGWIASEKWLRALRSVLETMQPTIFIPGPGSASGLRAWLCDAFEAADIERNGVIMHPGNSTIPRPRRWLRRLSQRIPLIKRFWGLVKRAWRYIRRLGVPGSAWLYRQTCCLKLTHTPFSMLMMALNVDPAVGLERLHHSQLLQPNNLSEASTMLRATLGFEQVEALVRAIAEHATPVKTLFAEYATAKPDTRDGSDRASCRHSEASVDSPDSGNGEGGGGSNGRVKGRDALQHRMLSLDGWLRFCRLEQGLRDDDVPAATSQFNAHLVGGASHLPLLGFERLLLHPSNDVVDTAALHADDDRSQPLASYFISTSHNTYLADRNQLAGKSDADMYRRVLTAGCRCVEIDVWDGTGGGSGVPEVTHGATLTTRISFACVCDAIREYAFVTSPLPLILSLEMHCIVAQQKKVAAILIETFGDALIMQSEVDALGRAPLEALSRRVIVKGKCAASHNRHVSSHAPAPSTGSTAVPGVQRESSCAEEAAAPYRSSGRCTSRSSKLQELSKLEMEMLEQDEEEMAEQVAVFYSTGRASMTGSCGIRGSFTSVVAPPSPRSPRHTKTRPKSVFAAEFALAPPMSQTPTKTLRHTVHATGKLKFKSTSTSCAPPRLTTSEEKPEPDADVLTQHAVSTSPSEVRSWTTVESPGTTSSGISAIALSSARSSIAFLGKRIGEARRRPSASGAITKKKSVANELLELFSMRSVPLDHLIMYKVPEYPIAVTSVSEAKFVEYEGKSRREGSSHTDAAWQRQTNRQLVRVYPRATRVRSDNANPLPGWRMGMQMVRHSRGSDARRARARICC
jgi:hypothetical protein